MLNRNCSGGENHNDFGNYSGQQQSNYRHMRGGSFGGSSSGNHDGGGYGSESPKVIDMVAESSKNRRKALQFLAGVQGVARKAAVTLRKSSQMHNRNCKNLPQEGTIIHSEKSYYSLKRKPFLFRTIIATLQNMQQMGDAM